MLCQMIKDFTDFSFKTATPESVGVDSRAITAFARRIKDKGLGVQGFMFYRHGKLVSQMIASPYDFESKRHVYSISKTWTSTAIGLARDEGLLSLTDRIIDIFPDKLPEKISDNLRRMTIHDVLCMTCGHSGCAAGDMISSPDGDWIKAFLAKDVPFEPGRHFAYNSGGSYMLSAIITRLTGKSMVEYLTPRLLNPLGISGAYSDVCPRGICYGGWGMHVSEADMLKLGVLYLNGGVWEGERILSRDWVRLASSYKSDNENGGSKDWSNGYCYQIWRCQNNCFRGDGAYGQLIVVSPDADSVLALISEDNRFQDICDAYWETIFAACSKSTPYRMEYFYAEPDDSIPENPVALAELRDVEKSFCYNELLRGDEEKSFAAEYALEGDSPVKAVGIETEGKRAAFILRFENGRICRLEASNGSWSRNKLSYFPACVFEMMVSRDTYRECEPSISFKWDGGKLLADVQCVDSPHGCRLTFDFDEETLTRVSTLYAYDKTVIKLKKII